jgi:hypothetical protein
LFPSNGRIYVTIVTGLRGCRVLNTELIGLASALVVSLRKVLGSNLAQDIGCILPPSASSVETCQAVYDATDCLVIVLRRAQLMLMLMLMLMSHMLVLTAAGPRDTTALPGAPVETRGQTVLPTYQISRCYNTKLRVLLQQ